MRRTTLLVAGLAFALASPLGASMGLLADTGPGLSGPPLLPGPPQGAITGPFLADALAAAPYAAGLTETLLRAQVALSVADRGERIAFDHEELPNTVLAGSFAPEGSDGDGFLAKVDERGDPVLLARIDSGLPDALFGVGVDAVGDVFGGGYAYDAAQGRFLFLAAKVDGAGGLEWLRLVPIPSHGYYTVARDLAVDSAGNAVLAGPDLHFAGFEYDTAVAKLDPEGNVLWARRLALPGTPEYVSGIATDPRNDDILLAGATWDRDGYHALVLRLDKDGDLLAREAVVADAIPYGIAVDRDGNVLLGGYALASGAAAAFVARLDPSLSLLWAQTIAVGTSTVATDVDVDRDGNAVLGGHAYSGFGGHDVFVAKVTPMGATLFTRLIDGVEGGGSEYASGVATSPDGLFIATGGSVIGADGNPHLWVTKSLGVGAAGAVGGVLNTALNAPRLV